MITTIVVIAILVLVVLWVISTQRSLVGLDEFCKNALSQIGVQQASRWDALTALAELTKGYSEHEYNTLKDVIAMRKPVNGNSTAAEVQAQEQALNNLARQIDVVVERYPDLKANENYLKTMDSVNVYENQVRQSRMVYNDSVTKYNRQIRVIPTNLIAGMLGFVTRDYLDETAGNSKSEMPSMKF